MTIEYIYPDKTNKPNLDVLTSAITTSSVMVDKALDHLDWIQKNAEIIVCMTNALSGEDKTELDTIVGGY